jgi:hypothetical protein
VEPLLAEIIHQLRVELLKQVRIVCKVEISDLVRVETTKVVVVVRPAVVARGPIARTQLRGHPASHEGFQAFIDGCQADAWYGPADAGIHILGGRMRVDGTKELEYGRSLASIA